MLDDEVRRAPRVCFFAHYHQDGIVPDHTLMYLAALKSAGFTTVVMSAASISDEEAKRLSPVTAGLIRRKNEGLDFGGWSDACRRFFPLDAQLLLLANDSVYGPVGDLGRFIDRLIAKDADFYGALESSEVAPHLQSWFLLFRPAAYKSQAFKRLLLAPMRVEPDKSRLIERYEVGLTQELVAAGYKYAAAFSTREFGGLIGTRPFNAAHLLWLEVVQAGIPFIKVELLRLNPMRVTDVDRWSEVVRSRAPDLEPAILADLNRRGRSSRPTLSAMTRYSPINWPEVRFLIGRNYRAVLRDKRIESALHSALFHTIVFGTSFARRAYRKSSILLKRRASGSL